MRKFGQIVLVLLVVLVLAVTLAGLSLNRFLNGKGLRSKVEATLTQTLHRQVVIERLQLSLWTGSLVAEQMTIADDPNFAPSFGTQPFLSGGQVRMGIEVMPLLLRRQVRLDRFRFDAPEVRLERDSNGTWNYASLGSPQHEETPVSKAKHEANLPDLAVSSVAIENASITVALAATRHGEVPAQTRLYEHVGFSVTGFNLARAFPYTLSATLPAGGSLRAKGQVGPIQRDDPAATPFSAKLEGKHLDLLAAGLVTPVSGVTGLIESIKLDVDWDGKVFHTASFVADAPHFEVLHTLRATGEPEDEAVTLYSRLGDHLILDKAKVSVGTLTVSEPGHAPVRYRALGATLSGWATGSRAPFTVNALIPGGGQVHANGTARIARLESDGRNANPEIDAQVALRHLDLAGSGLLEAHSALSSVVDADAHLSYRDQSLTAVGTARLARLKLAMDGQPSAQPVAASYSLRLRQSGNAGTDATIDRASFTLGDVGLRVSGGFHLAQHGPASLNLKVNGDAMPIDTIESFLPAVGVSLPEGSRLKGGTLTVAMTVTGPTQNLVIDGPLRLDQTHLAGFDLGSKLASLARFTGGRFGSDNSSGTSLRSFACQLHSAGGVIRTDQLVFDLAGIGPGTGSGTISPGGKLNYKISLKVLELIPGEGGSGLAREIASQLPGAWAGRALDVINTLAEGAMKAGIPILIGGTTHHPTITPNLGALIPAEHPRR
jgi:hypothetical protein